MSTNLSIGKVTHVFVNKRCVAILVKQGRLCKGDVIRFIKGDVEKGMPGSHDSTHVVDSIQIGDNQEDVINPRTECAVLIRCGELPPNNATVLLLGRNQEFKDSKPYFVS